MDLRLGLHLPGHVLRDDRGEHVVYLPDVGDGVLARGGLHGHGTVRGDQAVAAVAAADGPVVAVLLREAGDGRVEDAPLVVVAGVDLDLEADAGARPAYHVEGVLVDVGGELVHGGPVVVPVVDEPVDHGAGDGHGYPVAHAGAHDLDILAGLGEPLLVGPPVDEPLGLVGEGVGDGERGVPDAEGGVVGQVVRRLVDAGEVVGPHAELGVEDDVGVQVEERVLPPQHFPDAPEGGGLDREECLPALLVDDGGGAAVHEDVDRLDDAAAAELRAGAAGDDLGLVGVVVEDVADLALVHPAEGLGDGLGDVVGHGVGVADPLPLDDLDLPHRHGDLVDPVDVDVLLLRSHGITLRTPVQGSWGASVYRG